jgi:hypothetical protein
VDAAYEVFIEVGFDDFQQYAFELQTTAAKNLAPKRIKEYMKIIHQEQGPAMCQVAMEYVIIVLGKYLQMMVAYSIFKEDPARVTTLFEQFNEKYTKLCEVFQEVTHEGFKPGQQVVAKKPVAPVKPTQRAMPELGVSSKDREQLQSFLERNSLLELQDVFLKKGVTLEDVLQMDDKEMEAIGIKAYKIRKQLHGAIRNLTNDGSSSDEESSASTSTSTSASESAPTTATARDDRRHQADSPPLQQLRDLGLQSTGESYP